LYHIDNEIYGRRVTSSASGGRGDMRAFICLFGIFLGSFSFDLVSREILWTCLHKKRFTSFERVKNQRNKTLRFEKSSVAPFNQLVFSWNAFRPKSGHFSFFAKIRNLKTKKWGPWRKMLDWGASIQRSYADTSQKGAKYLYVRLETGLQNLADAFSVKIVSSAGANLSKLHGFSVCTADFNCFRPEKVTDQLLNLRSVYVRNVPRKSQMILNHQRSAHMCSPTSWSMLTGFLSKKDVDPLDFAKHAFDVGLNSYGTWQFNVAHAFEQCRGRAFFSVARFHSFKYIHKQLIRGLPVIVSIRGFLRGAPKSYDNGHLMVVVGWDSKRRQVICHDPAFASNRKVARRYDIKNFLSAWERSRRLAYLVEPQRVFRKKSQGGIV